MTRSFDLRRLFLGLAAAVLVAVLALGVAMVVGPAGADDATATDAATRTGTGASEADEGAGLRDEVRACLEEHGIEIPDPPVDADGRRVRPHLSDEQRAAIRAALADCGLEHPFANRPGFHPLRAELRAQLRECLAEQGVDLPDPETFAPGERPELSPELRAALEACRADLGAELDAVRDCVREQWGRDGDEGGDADDPATSAPSTAA